MTLYCGVDGGGTRTRALLVDERGAFLGYGASGASNPKAVGLDGSARSVCEALQRAFREYTGKDEDIQLFLGLAGVRTGADRTAVMTAFSEPLDAVGLGGTRVAIGHDLDVAHAAALGGEPGVVLVAGTGSAALGRDATGRTRQAGGWGWYIDDPGSGYWLGYQAMRAAARSCDGRGPMTVLEEKVRAFLRIPSLHEMPNIIYNPHFSRERVAELAPIIFEAAEGGDVCAEAILREGFRELALMVATVSRVLDLERPLVSAVGGITHRGVGFDTRFAEALNEQIPFARITHSRATPVVGSVILAMNEDGRRMNAACMDALQEAAAKAAALPPKIDVPGSA
ncbi:MAG TPA: BadF/BadG/BcrA/BcrD ATPase family protein [Opitutales bacterium]|nr:BadF/BadG/BcrA/BcrD ATPase family protein [Opitutales bacterium]